MSTNDPRVRCQNCYAFERVAGTVGKCRRHAPGHVAANNDAIWPETRASDWCCDGRPRPKPAALPTRKTARKPKPSK